MGRGYATHTPTHKSRSGFPERLCSPMLTHTARDWRGYAAHTPRLFLLSIRYRRP